MYFCSHITSPDGGIGRRAGLKHQWGNSRAGSIPALGTEAEKVEKLSPFFIFTPRNLLVCINSSPEQII